MVSSMKVSPKVISYRLKKLFAIWLLVSMTVLSTVAFADTWSFVVAGDGRTDTRQTVPDPTGINTQVFKKIVQAIALKKPRFMLFTGDLVSGENASVHTKIAEQFSAWTTLVKE